MPKFDRDKFFAGFRERIDETIEQEQVDGLEFILGQMESDPFWKHIPQIAYALATTFHETAGSFQPVEEGYYLGSKAKAFQKTLRYYPYFGRGYVQLTWKTNYKKAGDVFGEDLVKNPARALDRDIAYKTLTYGMHQGWFTGKKLDDFIRDSKKDYANARTIINGHDKAGLIAGYARSFEKILNSAAISPVSSKEVSNPQSPAADGTPAEPSAPTTNNLTVPLVPLAQPVVEVPQVAPTTETPKEENTLATIGNKVVAFWGIVGGVATAIISALAAIPLEIIAVLVLAIGIIVATHLIIKWRRQEAKERRDYEAAQAAAARAHEIQVFTLKSHADPALQAVVIAAPPPVELANADSPATEVQ